MTEQQRDAIIAQAKRDRVAQGLPPTYAGKTLELLASAIARHPSGHVAGKKSAA